MAIPLTIFFKVPKELPTTFCYDKLPIEQCFENSIYVECKVFVYGTPSTKTKDV
jgi:hypothetical protein